MCCFAFSFLSCSSSAAPLPRKMRRASPGPTSRLLPFPPFKERKFPLPAALRRRPGATADRADDGAPGCGTSCGLRLVSDVLVALNESGGRRSALHTHNLCSERPPPQWLLSPAGLRCTLRSVCYLLKNLQSLPTCSSLPSELLTASESIQDATTSHSSAYIFPVPPLDTPISPHSGPFKWLHQRSFLHYSVALKPPSRSQRRQNLKAVLHLDLQETTLRPLEQLHNRNS